MKNFFRKVRTLFAHDGEKALAADIAATIVKAKATLAADVKAAEPVIQAIAALEAEIMAAIEARLGA